MSHAGHIGHTGNDAAAVEVVAHHEAGHAVAADWLKLVLSRLSIEPEGHTFGRIVLRTSRRMLERCGPVRSEGSGFDRARGG